MAVVVVVAVSATVATTPSQRQPWFEQGKSSEVGGIYTQRQRGGSSGSPIECKGNRQRGGEYINTMAGRGVTSVVGGDRLLFVGHEK